MLDHVRNSHFPYCIEKQSDGTYVILNRNSKPTGYATPTFIDYQEHPVRLRIPGLDKVATQLSCTGEPKQGRIYLYDDNYLPWATEELMSAYLERLRILMNLRCSPAD